MCLPWLLFVNATKQAQYGWFVYHEQNQTYDRTDSSTANKPYRARLAALAKNSRERGWVHSGGGFGRMFRIAWYSAK